MIHSASSKSLAVGSDFRFILKSWDGRTDKLPAEIVVGLVDQ